MTQGRPWWYSGDEATEAWGEPVAPQEPAGADERLDVAALAQGAQRLIEWATERVVAPHAEHADPAGHPDCLMCRAALLMGPASSAGSVRDRPPVEPIVWLPVLDERTPPSRHP